MKETIKNMEKIVKGLNHASNLSNSNSYKSEEELMSLIYSEDFFPSMLYLAKKVLKDLKEKENEDEKNDKCM